LGLLNAFLGDFVRTSGVIGLLEASGVARWMFLVVLRVYVYVPPPILINNNLEIFWGFLSLCSPEVWKSFL